MANDHQDVASGNDNESVLVGCRDGSICHIPRVGLGAGYGINETTILLLDDGRPVLGEDAGCGNGSIVALDCCEPNQQCRGSGEKETIVDGK